MWSTALTVLLHDLEKKLVWTYADQGNGKRRALIFWKLTFLYHPTQADSPSLGLGPHHSAQVLVSLTIFYSLGHWYWTRWRWDAVYLWLPLRINRTFKEGAWTGGPAAFHLTGFQKNKKQLSEQYMRWFYFRRQGLERHIHQQWASLDIMWKYWIVLERLG